MLSEVEPGRGEEEEDEEARGEEEEEEQEEVSSMHELTQLIQRHPETRKSIEAARHARSMGKLAAEGHDGDPDEDLGWHLFAFYVVIIGYTIGLFCVDLSVPLLWWAFLFLTVLTPFAYMFFYLNIILLTYDRNRIEFFVLSILGVSYFIIIIGSGFFAQAWFGTIISLVVISALGLYASLQWLNVNMQCRFFGAVVIPEEEVVL